MRCYVCGSTVSSETNDEVQQILDEDCEKDVQGDPTSIVSRLGLFRCAGPDDVFDDQDRVVLCMPCVEGAQVDGDATLDGTEL